MTEPYRKKEATKIPDEVGLVIAMLRDDLINHKLKHVVPHKNIIRKKAETFLELPAILVEKIGSLEMLSSEPLPPDARLGYYWQAEMTVTCVCPEDIYTYYPPAPPGEVEPEETKFDGAENFLRVPAWLVYTILSENREGYTDPETGLMIDDIQPVSFLYMAGDYRGVSDLWAITQTFNIKFEMEAQNG